MKKILFLLLVTISFTAFAQNERYFNRVYCGSWTSDDGSRSGYSLYREYDHRDIGNAFFTSLYECREAADVANKANTNIACSKYHNRNTQKTFYSVYRISDLQDLGRWGFSEFSSCQTAVKYSNYPFYCGTYVNSNSDVGFSIWDIRTNQDVARSMYRSMGSCLEAMGMNIETEELGAILNLPNENELK